MDLQQLVNIIGIVLVPIGIAIGGFAWKQISGAKAEAATGRRELADFKLVVAENYLKRSEFKESLDVLKGDVLREIDKIDTKIGAIFEKLDKLL